MSSERLREAAALMRERAEAATTHTPWQLLVDDDYAPPGTVASTHPEGERTWVCKDARHTGEHIASWHPGVALAVADVFDALAARAEGIIDATPTAEFGERVAVSNLPGYAAAVVAADAYLGN